MNSRHRLHRLIDCAIDFFKEHNPDQIPDPDEFSIEEIKQLEPALLPVIDAMGNSELFAEVLALRERDRDVARPVILKTLASILRTSENVLLRREAVQYLGETWDYYQDDSGVVRTLTAALFDADDRVQQLAVDSLGQVGPAAVRAVPALKTLKSRSASQTLGESINQALRQIGSSRTN